MGQIVRLLEEKKQYTKKGGEYWTGRDIQEILGYVKWDKFENVISKAKMACESAGTRPEDQFLHTGKVITAGKGAKVEISDYYLTRYACYLVAMNGDTSKPEIGEAQTYFAIQTRRQEIQDKLIEDESRIELRKRVRNANKSLGSVAKSAGVQKYAIFHNAGYHGLYEMGLRDIKKKKGITKKEDLLDRAGRTELAANEFRITQTEEKLIRDKTSGEEQAIDTHYTVGQEVRETSEH